ncbi:hypothetical protein PTTG_04658, partial [Puccinia triticina 1-1 BBBD Race 1]
MSSNTPTSAEQHGGTAEEQQGDNANGDSLPAHDEAWISALVDRLVPQFQAQRTATADESAMQTDRQGRCSYSVKKAENKPLTIHGDVADPASTAPVPQVPSDIEDTSRLAPEFVVANARKVREQADKSENERRSSRKARGIAQKGPLAEHYNKFSRGIQNFVKFFLGQPDKPQDYPQAPTPKELEDQYWVEKRSEIILKQLNRVREALADRPAAEVDFHVGVAEKEIRRNTKSPPFTPASSKGAGKGCRPISPQM